MDNVESLDVSGINAGESCGADGFELVTQEEMKRKIRNKLQIDLRDEQLQAIMLLQKKENCVVLLPTGFGKSAIFQLGSYVCAKDENKTWVTLVICPLRSIIHDQMHKISAIGKRLEDCLKPIFFPSKDGEEQEIFSNNMRVLTEAAYTDNWKGKHIIAFLTPEKLNLSNWLQNLFRNLSNSEKLFAVFVDEAHLWSAWSRDFRPSFKCVRRLKNEGVFGNVPLCLLTATADERTVVDMKLVFDLDGASIIQKRIDEYGLNGIRPNLKYGSACVDTLSMKQIYDKICERIKTNHDVDTPGVVFCLTKRDACDLSVHLRQAGLRAEAMHADMSFVKRGVVQDRWARDDDSTVRILCATSCFSMGVDKANVRFSYHLSAPRSISDLIQESGRAGRDGNDAECFVYYRTSDVKKIISTTDGKDNRPDDVKKIHQSKFQSRDDRSDSSRASSSNGSSGKYEPHNKKVKFDLDHSVGYAEEMRLREYTWFSKTRKDLAYRTLHYLQDRSCCRRIGLGYVSRFIKNSDLEIVSYEERTCSDDRPMCDNCRLKRNLILKKPPYDNIPLYGGVTLFIYRRNISYDAKMVLHSVGRITRGDVRDKAVDERFFNDKYTHQQRHKLEFYNILNVFVGNKTNTVTYMKWYDFDLWELGKVLEEKNFLVTDGKKFRYDMTTAERFFVFLIHAGILEEKVEIVECNVNHCLKENTTDPYDSVDFPYKYIDVPDHYETLIEELPDEIMCDFYVEVVEKPAKKPTNGTRTFLKKTTKEKIYQNILESMAELVRANFGADKNPTSYLRAEVAKKISEVLPSTREELIRIDGFPIQNVEIIENVILEITNKALKTRPDRA